MLENIKSDYIGKKIFEYIPNKTVLNIFKYSRFYQSKFNFSKNDYLLSIYSVFSKDINYELLYEDKTEREIVKNIFKALESKLYHDISNDILKESIIIYFAIKKEYILSINHIYFNEIIKKKIELGQKNVKIGLFFKDRLSQNDIINLITRYKYSNEKIINYINERMDFNNKLIKKLEILLNSNIFIYELYFDFEYSSPYYIDYKYDIIEYKEIETDEEKNILINFKLKRGELINKILDKNCKYITKMEYLVIKKKPSDNINIIFPLVDLDKFENLIFLDLNIFIEPKVNFDFSFTHNLNKLKYLKITIEGNNVDNVPDIYIKKQILDNLETLKIKNANWFIPYNESFHFKNIKNFHIQSSFIPNILSTQKKYFYEELLKGNVSWEKLDKFKISFTYLGWEVEDKEEFINKEIIELLTIANLRDIHDPSYSEFFPAFFNYIFKNQNICIKTKSKYNKNIEELKIKIYDDNDCWSCKMDNIIYHKKGKNVNITVGGRLYELNCSLYDDEDEYPMQYINFENVYRDPCLDSFTIEDQTINELKLIKKYISEQHEKTKLITKNYNTLYDNCIEKYIKGDSNNLENEINELKKKEESFGNQQHLMWNDIDEKRGFDKAILKIKRLLLYHEELQIHRLIKKLTDLPKDKNEKSK